MTELSRKVLAHMQRTNDPQTTPFAAEFREEAVLWKRGASNAGYHYLGCAKTFALMGRAFAEATLTILKDQGRR